MPAKKKATSKKEVHKKKPRAAAKKKAVHKKTEEKKPKNSAKKSHKKGEEKKPLVHVEEEKKQQQFASHALEAEGKKEHLEEKEEAEVSSEHGQEDDWMQGVAEVEEEAEASQEDLDRIDEELSEIYKNSDGSMPDMKEFKRAGRFRFLRAIASLVLACGFLGAVVYAGLFIFQQSGSFAEEEITLTVVGDDEILPGAEARYRIRYRNSGDTSIQDVSLEIRYPEGFEYTESTVEPVSEQGDRFELGTIAAEDSGFIDVFGKHYGTVGQEESIRVFMHYMPETFSSVFQKVATYRIVTKELPYGIEVSGPDAIVSGIEVPLTLTLTPTGEGNVTHTALFIEETPNFRLVDSSIEPDQFQESRWSIPQGDAFTLSLTGVFLIPEGEMNTSLPIQLIGWSDESKAGEGFVLETEAFEADVLEHAVQVLGVVNGTTKALSVQPGEILNTSIIVRNSGESTLKNVRIRAMFDAPSADNTSIMHWLEVQDPQDGTIVGEQLSQEKRRGMITWTSSDVPALASIGPGESITIDVGLPVKSSSVTDLSQFTTSQAEFVADIQFTEEGEEKILSTTPIVYTINSDLALEVRDELQTTVNQDDTHVVQWILTNQFHALENITLSAEVYGDTILTASSSPAGLFSYNEEEKKLSWEIPEMPTSVDVLALGFTLQRQESNPSQTQLVSKVELRATDTMTGESIILVGNALGL